MMMVTVKQSFVMYGPTKETLLWLHACCRFGKGRNIVQTHHLQLLT